MGIEFLTRDDKAELHEKLAEKATREELIALGHQMVDQIDQLRHEMIDRLVEEIEFLRLQVASHTHTPPVDEADVTVEIAIPMNRSRLETGVSHVTHDLLYASNAEAKTRAKAALAPVIKWHGVHLMNFGVGDLAPWNGVGSPPNAPNMASFDAQAGLAKEMGGKLIVALYNIPWWLKGKTTFANGVQTTTKYTVTQAFDSDGRLLTDMKAQFHTLMVKALKHILTVHGCRDFVTWNEYKGHQGRARDNKGQMFDHDDYPGTPGMADLGFCEVYRLWAVALEEACRTAVPAIPLDSVRLYGPYVLLRSQGANDADSVPVGHFLRDRTWGSMNKTGTQAMDYFLDWVRRTGVKFDGLSIDFGTGSRDGVTKDPDDFAVAYDKVADVLSWARGQLTNFGFSALPIVASELYVKPQAKLEAGHLDYRAAQKAVALIAWTEWSGSIPLWWGIKGEAEEANGTTDGAPGEGGLVTSTSAPTGGQPLPFLGVLKMFLDHFGAGTQLYDAQVSDLRVRALVSDSKALLVNTTPTDLTVRVENDIHPLPAYAVTVVDR